jgi:hypothetical protein
LTAARSAMVSSFANVTLPLYEMMNKEGKINLIVDNIGTKVKCLFGLVR